jgi:hypothetical protein
MYNEALCKYCLVLLSITKIQNIYRMLLGFVRYYFHHNVSSGIMKALKNVSMIQFLMMISKYFTVLVSYHYHKVLT